jgi:hydrogenase maturation protease
MTTPLPLLLIIGYGNSLRRDDGAGLVLAQRLAEQWKKDGHAVRLLLSHQLTPEMAIDLAHKDVAGVLFVDASVEPRTELALLPVDEEQSTSGSGHQVGAATLLAYADQLFGHGPAAWLLPVPAVDLGHGEGLSVTTVEFLDAALKQADEIWAQFEAGWSQESSDNSMASYPI